MKTFLFTAVLTLILGIILMPAIGNYLQNSEQREWCERFETRTEFTREEAGRYLDYCPHFDMNSQTEVRGRLVK